MRLLTVTRGCNCVICTIASRKSRPTRSIWSTVSLVVRPGNEAQRLKTKTAAAIILSPMIVNATVQWKCREKDGGAVIRRKYRPPRPKGREGRLFPPEQSWKASCPVDELRAARNKILA